MANLPKLRRLLEAQARGYTLLASMLIRQLMAVWEDFDKWYDDDLITANAARSATIVEAAQRTVNYQTLTYMKFVYSQFEDLDFPTEEEIDALNDEAFHRVVSPLEEWDRPAEQFRYAKSIGKSEQEATQAALDRMSALADMDLALAMRDQSSKVIKASPRVTGYRRVLHPELAKSGTSCGLCIAASTRIYKKKELLPLHDHCNCGVMPVVGTEDPGKEFNEEDLKQLYALAGGTGAQELSRVRYRVDEHGELGPYLVEHGAKNRSAGSKRAQPVTQVDSTAAQIASLEASLERLLARSRAGEDLAQPINWQQDRLRVLRQSQREAA